MVYVLNQNGQPVMPTSNHAYDEECDLINPETLKVFLKKELGEPYKSFHIDTHPLYGESDFFDYKSHNDKTYVFVVPVTKNNSSKRLYSHAVMDFILNFCFLKHGQSYKDDEASLIKKDCNDVLEKMKKLQKNLGEIKL